MSISASAGRWRTSSYSGQGQDCVEVNLGKEVGVRDSKDPDGGQLAASSSAWRALLANITRD